MNRQDAKDAKKRRIEPDEALDRLAYEVIGAAIEVHRVLGPGYLESTYQKALAHELELRGVAVQKEAPVRVTYNDKVLDEGRIDLLVEGQLVVELKAVKGLAPIHRAQLISYLKATGHILGLLTNFNMPTLKDSIQRVIYY